MSKLVVNKYRDLYGAKYLEEGLNITTQDSKVLLSEELYIQSLDTVE